VYYRNIGPILDEVSDHAERVAGIMIANGANNDKGVAPGASLHASSVDSDTINPGYQHTLLAMQHVATQNSGDVRAINLSYGKAAPAGAALDGNSLLTLGLDWSARVHDTLYVVAGNQQGSGGPIPSDEYNGLTVAFTKKVGGVFRQVDDVNDFSLDAAGDRRSIDLVAPGRDIITTQVGGGYNVHPDPGTSFAAPHVTAAVALL
jgi:subtilisin family serine protease